VLAAKGRNRGFVVWTSVTLIAMGVISAIVGIAAIAFGQPYAVWFPLLLLGVLLLAILPFRLRQYRRGYEDLELRRMASMDA
jgi:purine-cytosine permease-like protein